MMETILNIITVLVSALYSIEVSERINSNAKSKIDICALKKGFYIKEAKGKTILNILSFIPGINLISSTMFFIFATLLNHSEKVEDKFFKKIKNRLVSVENDCEENLDDKVANYTIPSVIKLSSDDYTITDTDEKITQDSTIFKVEENPESFSAEEIVFGEIFNNSDIELSKENYTITDEIPDTATFTVERNPKSAGEKSDVVFPDLIEFERFEEVFGIKSGRSHKYKK